MAVLSADSTADLRHRGPCRRQKLTNGVATETYYKGGIVSRLAAGKITPVSADNLPFVGIVAEASDGAIGTSDKVDVSIEGEFLIPYASAALTDEGEYVYIKVSSGSDNPADLIQAGSGTGDMAIGTVTEYVSSTLGSWVKLHAVRVVKVA